MRRHRSHRSPDRIVSRRALRWAALAGAAAAAFAASSLAFGGLSGSATGGPMSVTTKRVFPGVRSTSAWNLKDASAGSGEVDNSDLFLTAGDSRIKTTGNWGSAFASNRWLEFDFNSRGRGTRRQRRGRHRMHLYRGLPSLDGHAARQLRQLGDATRLQLVERDLHHCEPVHRDRGHEHGRAQ